MYKSVSIVCAYVCGELGYPVRVGCVRRCDSILRTQHQQLSYTEQERSRYRESEGVGERERGGKEGESWEGGRVSGRHSHKIEPHIYFSR